MKILISWYALNNDFCEGKVNKEGPTMTFHKSYFNHDKHIILSSSKEGDIRMDHLLNALSTEYPSRKDLLEPEYMDISDVIDLEEIKMKVEQLLLKHKDCDIDIFFSPGTSAMQISWYICHTTLGLSTRLLQTRPARFTRDKSKIELLEIKVDKSITPITAIIKGDLIEKKSISRDDFYLMPSIKPIYDRAERIAQAPDSTALIYGESGTGKEHLAGYIHRNSLRKDKPFMIVNCSAMGDALLESRLFGYKKGAFTGADKDTMGLLEEANGGTVFLDEIGDISSYMQQALLRVLQHKEIQPLGGKVKKVDVRFISATNKDIKKLCSEEKFRWDLYYRLAVTELELPPLRERGKEEIKTLINHFLKTKKRQFRRSKTISLRPEVLSVLLTYPFPGNIRELENLIESLYVFHEDVVDHKDLPKRLLNVEPAFSFKWTDAEKLHIEKVLKHFHGNKRKTSKELGYGSINTLTSKMRKYGIQDATDEN